MQRSFIHEFGFSHLGMKELFEHVSTLVVVRVRLVERSAVGEQSRHVGNKQVLVNVIVALQAITYRLQICRNKFIEKYDCISIRWANFPQSLLLLAFYGHYAGKPVLALIPS